MGKGRECAESCMDYLAQELVHHYGAQQQQGPVLQVRRPDAITTVQRLAVMAHSDTRGVAAT